MVLFFKKIRFYQAIFFDKETPWHVKLLLLLAFLYLVFPFDLIADNIPFIGWVDDLTVSSILVSLAFRLVPRHVIYKARLKIFGENQHKM
ncbi:MAG: DUF1232 domain-containing protein [Proteobacteria bacterium]|nr:DUF1232 domain-containing protein [Pseudomonadota bacterium]